MKKRNKWWLAILPNSTISNINLLNLKLITNNFLPSDITDNKEIVFNDYAVPGLNYTPTDFVRNGNNEISFTIPIYDRKSNFGNADQLYAIEQMRNVEYDISSTTERLFAKNPICIYSGWGTHRPMLPVIIKSCSFSHKSQGFTNPNTGFIQYTEVSFTLRYLENSTMYKTYKIISSVGGVLGSLRTLTGIF